MRHYCMNLSKPGDGVEVTQVSNGPWRTVATELSNLGLWEKNFLEETKCLGHKDGTDWTVKLESQQ